MGCMCGQWLRFGWAPESLGVVCPFWRLEHTSVQLLSIWSPSAPASVCEDVWVAKGSVWVALVSLGPLHPESSPPSQSMCDRSAWSTKPRCGVCEAYQWHHGEPACLWSIFCSAGTRTGMLVTLPNRLRRLRLHPLVHLQSHLRVGPPAAHQTRAGSTPVWRSRLSQPHPDTSL